VGGDKVIKRLKRAEEGTRRSRNTLHTLHTLRAGLALCTLLTLQALLTLCAYLLPETMQQKFTGKRLTILQKSIIIAFKSNYYIIRLLKIIDFGG
jgi:hypothetical protein